MLWEKVKDDFFRDVTALGGAFFYFFIVLFFFLAGQKKLAAFLLVGFIVIYAITIVIRFFYFKERPKRVRFKGFAERIDASAFPSVHSARVTFLALFFIERFSSLWLDVLFVLLGGVVCYSRIFLGKHDGKDVGGGIVLGGLVLWLVTQVF